MGRAQALPKPPPRSAPSSPVLAMGLMSGTSQDGVDVALIETDGDIITRFGATAYRSWLCRNARGEATQGRRSWRGALIFRIDARPSSL